MLNVGRETSNETPESDVESYVHRLQDKLVEGHGLASCAVRLSISNNMEIMWYKITRLKCFLHVWVNIIRFEIIAKRGIIACLSYNTSFGLYENVDF